MKRLTVLALAAALLPTVIIAQDAPATTQSTAKKTRSQRRAPRETADVALPSGTPATPAPTPQKDPANAVREQLPGNPQTTPATPTK
jgi:hypothetical protein